MIAKFRRSIQYSTRLYSVFISKVPQNLLISPTIHPRLPPFLFFELLNTISPDEIRAMESFVGISPHAQNMSMLEVIQNYVADRYDVDLEGVDPDDGEFLAAHFWSALECVMQKAIRWENDENSPYNKFVFTYPRYVLTEATPVKTMSMKSEGIFSLCTGESGRGKRFFISRNLLKRNPSDIEKRSCLFC